MTEITTTVGEIQPQTPIPVTQPSKAVYPIYSWKTGTQFVLSKTRKIICDVWLETRNVRECQRAIFEGVRRKLSIQTIKRIMELPEVKEYIGEQLSDRGWGNSMTPDKWKALMAQHMQGFRKMSGADIYCMKVMAPYIKGLEQSQMAQFNQQINITQSNGKE